MILYQWFTIFIFSVINKPVFVFKVTLVLLWFFKDKLVAAKFWSKVATTLWSVRVAVTLAFCTKYKIFGFYKKIFGFTKLQDLMQNTLLWIFFTQRTQHVKMGGDTKPSFNLVCHEFSFMINFEVSIKRLRFLHIFHVL